jgi:hypothetical protein
MLVTEYVDIKVSSKYLKVYRDLGYICNVNDVINIHISNVAKYSKIRVNAICFICNLEKETNYSSYNISIDKGGYYCCSQKCSNIKVRNTNLDRYGVDVPAKSNIILDKMKKTSLERYGTSNTSSLYFVKEKMKKTNIERYGTSCIFKNDEFNKKIKKTIMEKYGVDNVSKSLYIKEKKEKTMMDRYGVKNPFRLPESVEKSQKNNMKTPLLRYKNTEILYQGSYELDFLDKYENLNIQNGKRIKYYFNNLDSIYISDFYLPEYNLIIEIKSTYTYNYDLDKNLSKQKATIQQGFNFIFIIDKKYDDFEIIIKNKSLNL